MQDGQSELHKKSQKDTQDMLIHRITPILTRLPRNTTSQHRTIHNQQRQARLPPKFVFQLNNQIRKPVKTKVMTSNTAESPHERLLQIQTIVGHKFNNVLYLWEALQSPGSGVFMVDGRTLYRGNESMAIVGDSALQTALVGMWFKTGQQKGRLNIMHIALLCLHDH